MNQFSITEFLPENQVLFAVVGRLGVVGTSPDDLIGGGIFPFVAFSRYQMDQFNHVPGSTCKAVASGVARGVGALFCSAPALFNFIHSRLTSARRQGRALISAGNPEFTEKTVHVMSAWSRGPCSSLCKLPTKP